MPNVYASIDSIRAKLSAIAELSTGWKHGEEGMRLLRINQLVSDIQQETIPLDPSPFRTDLLCLQCKAVTVHFWRSAFSSARQNGYECATCAGKLICLG